MNDLALRWTPAALLGLGSLLVSGVGGQRALPLRAPLESTMPMVFEAYRAEAIEVGADERELAGFTDYLMRVYRAETEADPAWFSVYIAYYDRQAQGRTIHSPRNCLPGAGWEPLTSELSTVETKIGRVAVNRYLLQRGNEQALVLYWYQGRGRVEANEYRVKWDLLRDSALHRRSDEALVRIVVPVGSGNQVSEELAERVAANLVPQLSRALPN